MEDNPYQKREKSSAVREALRLDPKRVRTEEMFAASFPDIKEHQNHPIFGKVCALWLISQVMTD